MQVILNVIGSFRTAGSSHNKEVVALYRWPLEQVPLYWHSNALSGMRVAYATVWPHLRRWCTVT